MNKREHYLGFHYRHVETMPALQCSVPEHRLRGSWAPSVLDPHGTSEGLSEVPGSRRKPPASSRALFPQWANAALLRMAGKRAPRCPRERLGKMVASQKWKHAHGLKTRLLKFRAGLQPPFLLSVQPGW